jgi:tRNA-binding EMAP/Myf-like protein
VITDTKGVVVGRVVKVRPHPDGDYIWLANLDIGTDGEPQIVWGGAPIVAVGDLVPVAKPGAWLPATKDKRDRYKIRRRHYRGELSEGMLCSLAELGWDPSVTDRVARLNSSAGLCPGDSLDDVGESWPLILRPGDEFRAEEIYAALESPKKAVSLT